MILPTDAVAALLRPDPVDVRPELTLREVADTLERDGIGAVVVRGAGRVVGVVSERDLVRALAEGADPDVERASDVMTMELTAVDPHDSVEVVARTMVEGEIRHVLVDVDGETVGIVSMRDVVGVLLASLAAAPAVPTPA